MRAGFEKVAILAKDMTGFDPNRKCPPRLTEKSALVHLSISVLGRLLPVDWAKLLALLLKRYGQMYGITCLACR